MRFWHKQLFTGITQPHSQRGHFAFLTTKIPSQLRSDTQRGCRFDRAVLARGGGGRVLKDRVIEAKLRMREFRVRFQGRMRVIVRHGVRLRGRLAMPLGGGFGLVWVKACAGRPGPWSAFAFVPTRLG